jgi:hypothetical protein
MSLSFILHPLVRLAYNDLMARGWESKAVEDQISESEARREARSKQALTESQIERINRRRTLLLERARLERERQAANKRRYLALLDRSIDHLDAELARLGDDESG